METSSRTCSSVPAPAHSDKSESLTSAKLEEDSFAEVHGRSGHLVVDSEGHRGRISKLFNSPEFSDVVIVAKQNGVTEGRFCCHRAILCSSSLHFDVLFKTGMQETKTNEVVLEFGADAVRKVLKYCYTGEVLLSDSEIESTLVVADYLAIPVLASACEDLVQKRVQSHNVNQYLSFADRFSLHGLLDHCASFLQDNFCAVIQHTDFFNMSPKTFKFVLQSDSLCIDSEFTIFQALEQWMEHAPEHEAAALELFSLIRFPTMSARELCEVSQSPFVKRHPELTALVLQAFTHICSSDDAHMTAACQTYRPRTMQTGVDFQFCMKQESWTAPISGLFRITATGAKAADGLHKRGGLGAVLSGVFHLEKGQRLKVLCGGMSSRSPTGSTGGAGATYVLCDNEDEPLLVAGGGGGTRGMEHDLDGVNATLLPHGADGVAQGKHEEGRGGRDGMGGSGSCFLGVGGGGGGYRSPGMDGNASSENGASLLETTGPTSCTSFGGFGGGGGGLGGGGGGGYSGGGGGPGGGGGGSFVRSDALGVVKEIGSWGHGSAKISFCASLKGRTMPLYKGTSATARFQFPAIFRTRSSIN